MFFSSTQGTSCSCLLCYCSNCIFKVIRTLVATIAYCITLTNNWTLTNWKSYLSANNRLQCKFLNPKCTRMHDFVCKIFRITTVQPRISWREDEVTLPATTPRTAFGRARGRFAPQLRGPKMKLALDHHNVGDRSAPMTVAAFSVPYV